MTNVILLGPQRLRPTLRDAVRSTGVVGRITTITAGWEERETEDAELATHLSGRTHNLKLWERTELIFAADPELLAGLETRKERIRRVANLYQLRLSHAMSACRELARLQEPEEILAPEIHSAIDAARELDRHHLERVAEIQAEFEDRYRLAERPDLAYHRDEVAKRIEDSSAIAIAGGHVGVLLNRLRLFDIPALVGRRPIFAWSAGAMALGPRVVLFHDSPPQGFDNAEVYEPGMGVYTGLIPFPHARRRLRLHDEGRVSLLSRRFEPLQCVPLDEGDQIEWRHHYWSFSEGTRILTPLGTIDSQEGVA